MKLDLAAGGAAPPEYLEAAAQALRAVKRRSYELMHIEPGHRVIDIGCGPGLDTLNLGRVAGAAGRVVGVDLDRRMIQEAGRRTTDAGLQHYVFHHVADACMLPYRSGIFDSARSDRMLMHLKCLGRAVDEMTRVLKPGGWMVLTEPDWGTLSIASTLTSIERRLAEIRADHTLASGYAGRRLYQLLRERDFHEIAVEVVAVWSASLQEIRYLGFLDTVESEALELGLLSEHEIGLWREDLQELDRAGHCFASMNVVTVAGRNTAG